MIATDDVRRRMLWRLVTTCSLSGLVGCAPMAAAGAVASIASSAMEMAGLGNPDKVSTEVPLTLEAGTDSNLSRNAATSVVVRVYYLRDAERFSHASMAQLIEPAQEAELLGSDMIAARDVTLRPGQRYTHTERVPHDAKIVGLAAFFHSPVAGGWKCAFETIRAADSGIAAVVGANAVRVVSGQILRSQQNQR
jgi:type VI secretion system protein VasD